MTDPKQPEAQTEEALARQDECEAIARQIIYINREHGIASAAVRLREHTRAAVAEAVEKLAAHSGGTRLSDAEVHAADCLCECHGEDVIHNDNRGCQRALVRAAVVRELREVEPALREALAGLQPLADRHRRLCSNDVAHDHREFRDLLAGMKVLTDLHGRVWDRIRELEAAAK